MASSLPILSFFFSILSLFPSSLSLSSQSLSNAIAALSSSDFVSMALTLDSAQQTLIPSYLSSLTVFSPSDPAFSDSGQPPLSLLRFHLSPDRISPQTLGSYSFGTKIRTLRSDLSLIVTTSVADGRISVNGVKINGSAVFDDGSIVVYGVDQFFDPSFDISTLPAPALAIPGSDFECKAPIHSGSLTGAPNKIRHAGYSLIAAFLDLQLGWNSTVVMTVFAPSDGALDGYGGNFSDFVGIFRRHAVPCKIKGVDLERLGAGKVLPTFEVGFEISVDRSNDQSLLNGVPVTAVDLYGDELVVVHGIKDVLVPLDTSVDFG